MRSLQVLYPFISYYYYITRLKPGNPLAHGELISLFDSLCAVWSASFLLLHTTGRNPPTALTTAYTTHARYLCIGLKQQCSGSSSTHVAMKRGRAREGMYVCSVWVCAAWFVYYILRVFVHQ